MGSAILADRPGKLAKSVIFLWKTKTFCKNGQKVEVNNVAGNRWFYQILLKTYSLVSWDLKDTSKSQHSPCADLNEIGIGICRGGKKTRGFPPPWTPYDFANISPRCMKIFLDNLECICWSGRSKFLADLHSGQNYKRLKKMLLKMMGFVLPHMIRPIMAGKSWKKFFCVFLI